MALKKSMTQIVLVIPIIGFYAILIICLFIILAQIRHFRRLAPN